ncbi:hypothetical protein KC19_5G195200 [Ceratodon purpureus]|uniref:Uncharacterized protein n=1 Tax=Ceratodon purpureus TaxID=3225 RepID=A0A8T0I4C7_CERPU|nr:hypothetical protein KC19_5G195200 [Ceratodon purpureus]
MNHHSMALAATSPPGAARMPRCASRSGNQVAPGPVRCAASPIELKQTAYLQRRLLSALRQHEAVSGILVTRCRSEIGAKCDIPCGFRVSGKSDRPRRGGLFRIGYDSSSGLSRPGTVKAKPQGWQDVEAELEPAEALPMDRDARDSVSQFEWKEFEQAVEYRDLGRALKALETLNNFESDARAEDRNDVIELSLEGSGDGNGSLRADSSKEAGTSYGAFALPRADYMKILDTCQNAQDLQLVGQAYGWLQNEGFLQNFGKHKARVFEAGGGRKVVTAEDMLASSGLDASSLSPKKWGLSGISAVQLFAGFAVFSFLVNNNIDIRPIAVVIVALGLLDSIYLGGTGQGQVLSLWPGYKRRMLVHEAGHVLVAYLLGCPVRGVVLDAREALLAGIAGQAGTQFWDESLAREVEQNRLTEASVDRYSIVLFAGIAAEGLVYGEAEGGESDENLYKGIISGLRPPWGPGRMSNHARWSVLQAFSMLKEHRKVHEAIVQELERNSSLATIVNTIETTMVAKAK